MTGKRLAIVLLLILSFFVAPSHAMAQDVRVLRGTLYQLSDTRGELSVEGTSGLRIDAVFNNNYISPDWDDYCPYAVCLPGDEVSLRSAYGVGLPTGSGQLTIRGQTYSLFTLDGADLQLQFDGAFVLPELPSSGTAEVSAPFAFSGFLEIPNPKEPGTYDVFELRGSGVATAFVSRNPYNKVGLIVGAVSYEFAPRVSVIPQ